jgi:hypothetical protein
LGACPTLPPSRLRDPLSIPPNFHWHTHTHTRKHIPHVPADEHRTIVPSSSDAVLPGWPGLVFTSCSTSGRRVTMSDPRGRKSRPTCDVGNNLHDSNLYQVLQDGQRLRLCSPSWHAKLDSSMGSVLHTNCGRAWCRCSANVQIPTL